MAGHSKFKNIMHRKGAQDRKRANLFTKIAREIYVAVKTTANSDPNFNSRLRMAIAAAKAANMPRDKIEGAIKKATSSGEGENYFEMRYEGHAPGGVAIIVEVLTDNKNRSAGEIRAAFSKNGGALGETGSVSYLFKRVGSISYPREKMSDDQILEVSLELGALDCIHQEDAHEIIVNQEDFNEIREGLEEKFGPPKEAGIIYKAENSIKITDIEIAKKLLKMWDILEDNDDVQSIAGNFEIADEIIGQLED